jgi:hypothetical protein
VLAEALGAETFAYRDETGLEADIVLELAGRGWAAFEVKLGVSQVDAAAATLRTLRDRVDLSVAGEPTALAVITGSGYGYTRPDGVSVIPIGALGTKAPRGCRERGLKSGPSSLKLDPSRTSLLFCASRRHSSAVEQLFRKQQVLGSNPSVGSTPPFRAPEALLSGLPDRSAGPRGLPQRSWRGKTC